MAFVIIMNVIFYFSQNLRILMLFHQLCATPKFEEQEQPGGTKSNAFLFYLLTISIMYYI